MSLTRNLVADLRARLGHAAPLAQPAPMITVAPPPRRVFPTERTRSSFAKAAARHTTALVGIGQVGTRYATEVVLQFQAELAVAHAAVGTELPDDWAEQNGLLPLQSRVTSHREFLLRPDLGRRLSDASLERLGEARRAPDVQPILADGLSAVACMGAGLDLLQAFTRNCEALGLSVGTPMCARYARVWLEDEIGHAVGAKVAAILLGERPGLGTGDGLSAYLVHGPKLGNTDGDRNMMSNIHARGTTPEQAGQRLARMAAAMIQQGRSGVDLDLSSLGGDDRALRAPQAREELVEVQR